jgi:SAM-dependent methyltransferase
MKLFYEIIYRYFSAPWDVGSSKELVSLVTSGQVKPSEAIDLGCGTGRNSIFLAKHGFNVTGVDFSPTAIQQGQSRARKEGVKVHFIVDDLTNLHHTKGVFDFLVDHGTFDDLTPSNRDLYIKNILPLTRTGTKFLLYCHEWVLRWWERVLSRIGFLGAGTVEPGEVNHRFGKYFEIKQIKKRLDYSKWPPGFAVYLMTRK